MKILKEQLDDYFKENKESLYFSNIKTLNGLVMYSMFGIILFSIGAILNFDSNKSFWLNISYGIYFIILVIVYFLSKRMIKNENNNYFQTKLLLYLSVLIIHTFIITISILITSKDVRPLFFLLINVITPTIFVLKKKEIYSMLIIPVIVFSVLSFFFRELSFKDDLYVAATSLIIGIPFNLLFHNIKLEGAYIRGLYQSQANTDAITNIPNRRSFNSKVKSSLNNKFEKSLLLVIIDIDKMKDINDNYGHHYGDLAIKGFASKLSLFAKENQLFPARIGGDEFVILGLHYHERQVEEVLFRIKELPKDLNIHKDIKITVSVGGYYTNNIKGRDFDEIFNEADKALYDVKTGNRNDYKLILDNKD